jgi:3'(2'), 5'-bisphosphate nucleotidase
MNLFDPIGSEIDFAIKCVKTACCLTRSIEERMVSPALEKEDRSPVTVADFSVQALVGYEISEAFPEIPLVAEESSKVLGSLQGKAILDQVAEFLSGYKAGVKPREVLCWIDRGQGSPEDRFWILDPVDGTKGFLRGGQYAVALAMAEQGQIQIGVLGCPHLDLNPDNLGNLGRRGPDSKGSIAVAVRGKGAWVSSLTDNLFQPLRVSTCADTRDAAVLRSYESGHTNVEQMSVLSNALNLEKEPIRLDSQAKYLLLGAGKGDLMVRLLSPGAQSYREKIWDQAAGSIVVEEAGGRITDLDGNALDFTTGRRLSRNRGILASNDHLHQDALTALRLIGA